MSRPRTTLSIGHPTLVVQITDDESRTLVDPQTHVAYHSGSGAMAETRHVYLINSGVDQRLSDGTATSVLEIGLGTGMALLATLDAAIAVDTPLSYTALENQWLDAGILRQLNLDRLVMQKAIVAQFLAWRGSLETPVPSGSYAWQAGPQQSVTVHHEDASVWAAEASDVYDAIYFDPFAPEANPELWQPSLVARMHAMLADGGRLVTYCVNRRVRDVFASVGFDVKRVRGPLGGKREVMIATKTEIGL